MAGAKADNPMTRKRGMQVIKKINRSSLPLHDNLENLNENMGMGESKAKAKTRTVNERA